MYHANNTYDPKYNREIIDVFSEGHGLARFLGDRGILRSTFYNWIDKYPIFKQSYAIAMLKGETFWYEKLEENLGNPDFKMDGFRFIMGNRFGVTHKQKMRPHDWLNSKDLVKSFDRLLKTYKEEGLTADALKEGIDVLLSIATLKEKSELIQRIDQLEEKIKLQNEKPL